MSAQANAGHGVDEWTGMRPFRDGDSPRQVVWTAYARELPLLVKEYGGAAAEWLQLRSECKCPATTSKSHLQQICRWILDADSRGARYALGLPGFPAESRPVRRSHPSLSDCAGALSLTEGASHEHAAGHLWMLGAFFGGVVLHADRLPWLFITLRWPSPPDVARARGSCMAKPLPASLAARRVWRS